MSFELNGAVVLLTGAASGMGAELAVQLAALGAHLALVDRNEAGLAVTSERARSANAAVRITSHVLDIADDEAVAALPASVHEAHGRISVLINNAGVALVGDFEQASLADFTWLMEINFWGAVRLTHACLPFLRREAAAQVVLTSSVFGFIGPPGQTAYTASKFALRGFGESLRHELAATGIGVSIVHPGGVNTNIARSARIGEGVPPQAAANAGKLAEALLRARPEDAARRIITGIVKRQPRILVGRDARIIDMIQRIAPVRYWQLLTRGRNQANIP